jgi:hypothetical protein
MPAWRLQDDAASGDVAIPLFEQAHMLGNGTAKLRLRGHALKVDFDRRFHDFHH